MDKNSLGSSQLFEYLLNQYKNAFNIKKGDIDSKEFLDGFNNWLIQMRIIGDSYEQYINNLSGVYPSHEYDVVEIGKSAYDSIALQNHFAIATPYTEGFAKFTDKPIIDVSKVNINELIMNNRIRIVTQNPYDMISMSSWTDLHNSGEYNITLGVFGNNSDKDKNKKLLELKNFSENLDGWIEDEYITNEDQYHYIITSARKVKVKTRWG